MRREEGCWEWQNVVDRRVVKCWVWKMRLVAVHGSRMMVQVWGHQVSYFSGGIKLNDEWSTVVRAYHCNVEAYT